MASPTTPPPAPRLDEPTDVGAFHPHGWLDPDMYPHVMDTILDHTAPLDICSLRNTTKHLRESIDPYLARHVVITASPNDDIPYEIHTRLGFIHLPSPFESAPDYDKERVVDMYKRTTVLDVVHDVDFTKSNLWWLPDPKVVTVRYHKDKWFPWQGVEEQGECREWSSLPFTAQNVVCFSAVDSRLASFTSFPTTPCSERTVLTVEFLQSMSMSSVLLFQPYFVNDVAEVVVHFMAYKNRMNKDDVYDGTISEDDLADLDPERGKVLGLLHDIIMLKSGGRDHRAHVTKPMSTWDPVIEAKTKFTIVGVDELHPRWLGLPDRLPLEDLVKRIRTVLKTGFAQEKSPMADVDLVWPSMSFPTKDEYCRRVGARQFQMETER